MNCGAVCKNTADNKQRYTMLVPAEAFAHIKCSACNKYLSYFPIYMHQGSLQPICGRCSENLGTTGSYVRNKTYETFAQFVKFPCMFDSEGCVERLAPADIPNHEKNCRYKLISCALDCVWQEPVAELLDHVQETHPGVLTHNGEFEIDMLLSYEVHDFLTYKDEIFALKRKFDHQNNTIRWSLSCCKVMESVSEYYYEMTVFNGSRSLAQKFPMKSADNFAEENVTVIRVDEIKKRLGDPSSIIGYINIFTLDDQQPAEEPKKPNPAIDWEMLRELECPVCFEHIIPPIFQCITGHSICGGCKNQVPECPTCKSEIKDTQNFTLEKMAFLINYPCKFSEFGCDFTSKPGQIKQHQKYCIHGPQLCPLKGCENCKWEGSAKDIYSHITAEHHDNILEIDNLNIFLNSDYFDGEDNQCYIKKFANVMFKIRYRYAQECFYWAVQLLGPQEEVHNYKFELDVQDNGNDNRRLFLRSSCSLLKDEQETFNEAGQYVFLKRGQIDSFLTDQLSYTIRITKQ